MEFQKVTIEAEVGTVYRARANTDRTEGRGWQKTKYYAKTATTAKRLAKGICVQGSNGTVDKADVYIINGVKYVPLDDTIHYPNDADSATEKKLSAIAAVKAKLVAAGITEEDIAVLGLDK